MQFEQSSPSQLINRPHTWALIALILFGRFNATTVTKGREWYDIDTYENWASNGCGGIVDDVHGVVVRYLCNNVGNLSEMVVLYPTHTKHAARGLEKRHDVRITLIFSRIISFMLFTVLLSLMYYFRRISDSRFTWIHDLKNSWLNLLGLCHFPLNGMYRRMDWRIHSGWAG